MSSFLTTFNTELGRFHYTVMPFGAKVVGDVLQKKVDECFDKLDKQLLESTALYWWRARISKEISS